MISSASALTSQVSNRVIDNLRVTHVKRAWTMNPCARCVHAVIELISIMIRLERTHFVHADVIRLIVGQHSQFSANTAQMETRDLFIEVLGQYINLVFVFIAVN